MTRRAQGIAGQVRMVVVLVLVTVGIAACQLVAAGTGHGSAFTHVFIADEPTDTTDTADTTDTDAPASPRVQPDMPVPDPRGGVIHNPRDPNDPANTPGDDSGSDNGGPAMPPPAGIIGQLGNG